MGPMSAAILDSSEPTVTALKWQVLLVIPSCSSLGVNSFGGNSPLVKRDDYYCANNI